MQKTVEDYLRLPYTIEVIYDDSGQAPGYFARVVELPGCMTQADTFAELGEMIEDAMRLWIGSALEDGQPVPEPRPAEEYSGKFVVRLPKSLHRELAEAAEREGVSLNQWVNAALAHYAARGTTAAVPVVPAPKPARKAQRAKAQRSTRQPA